jgi:hypothetical protein
MRDALEHCRQLLQMGLCEFPAQNDGDSDDLSIPEHNFKVSTTWLWNHENFFLMNCSVIIGKSEVVISQKHEDSSRRHSPPPRFPWTLRQSSSSVSVRYTVCTRTRRTRLSKSYFHTTWTSGPLPLWSTVSGQAEMAAWPLKSREIVGIGIWGRSLQQSSLSVIPEFGSQKAGFTLGDHFHCG